MKLRIFLVVFLCSSLAFADTKSHWKSDLALASGIVLAVAGTVVMAIALDGLQAQKRSCAGGICTNLPLPRSAILETGILASASGFSIAGAAVLIVLGALKAPDTIRF